MGKIFANKSLNDGYRYIWDEDTKFIVYQNNKGDIILGTINHEGQIKEKAIEKLCKLKINNFGILQSGSGEFINYKIIIYVKKFFNLAYVNEIKKFLKELLLSQNTLYDEHMLYAESVVHNDTISIINTNTPYSQYWKLEQDNGTSATIMIENIILKILLWFYDIGITRKKIEDCDIDDIEDYKNLQLFQIIHEKFINNKFQVLEESKLTIEKVYDQAQKENKNYDKIMKYLNTYIVNKIYGDSIEKENVIASKKAIQYYTIVGKPYPFAQKLEEERDKQLKLTK